MNLPNSDFGCENVFPRTGKSVIGGKLTGCAFSKLTINVFEGALP